MNFAPTSEQQEALRLFATGKSLVIEAGAGTGKTSTLKLLAESAPNRRGQYLAFNRAIVEESKQKFPASVRCNTAHSAAFRVMVQKPSVNMERLRSPRMKSWDIAARLGIKQGIRLETQDGERKNLSATYLAGLTMKAITAFCQSADPEPTAFHVPYIKGIDVPPGAFTNNRDVARTLVPYMRRAWADLMTRDGSLPFQHDHYLKAWQLDDPRIAVDFILFDEAQDANPVLVDIVRRQDSHAQLVWVGDSCQPRGTLVQRVREVGSGKRQSVIEEVPIEQIKEGDLVVSYDVATGHLHRRGNRVLGVSQRTFVGSLVQIDAGGKWVSNYTPDHHSVAKLGPAFAGKHVVYLMRRGQSYRIGRASGSYGGGGFGPLARAKKEGADALWILSLHDSSSDSAAAEALASHRFGIPGMLFNAALNRLASQEAIDGFWSAVGDLTESAERCLNWHQRDLRFPLWTQGDPNLLISRATRIRACNLMTGMHVPVIANAAVEWVEAKVGRRGPTEGCPVYSMTVENDHTYVGDGIVTHNCQQIYTFTGAINAMQTVGAEQTTYLTQSFRFGPAIAETANRILGQIEGAQLRLTGLTTIESTVGPVAEPDAILTRTNAEAVRNVLQAIKEGKRPHLVGGATEIVSFAKAAQALMDGGTTEHPDLACFDSWNEVVEYVDHDEQGGDLQLLVKLIDEFTVQVILDALDNMAHESSADVIVSTAHKSKGREWNTVQLGGDFPDQPEAEELRLLYVSITRAKMRLDHDSVPFLSRAKGADICGVCGRTIEPDARYWTPAGAPVHMLCQERAMTDADHDAPDHDFASCPRCIQRAREAEHEAEGGGTASSSALGSTQAGEGTAAPSAPSAAPTGAQTRESARPVTNEGDGYGKPENAPAPTIASGDLIFRLYAWREITTIDASNGHVTLHYADDSSAAQWVKVPTEKSVRIRRKAVA